EYRKRRPTGGAPAFHRRLLRREGQKDRAAHDWVYDCQNGHDRLCHIVKVHDDTPHLHRRACRQRPRPANTATTKTMMASVASSRFMPNGSIRSARGSSILREFVLSTGCDQTGAVEWIKLGLGYKSPVKFEEEHARQMAN